MLLETATDHHCIQLAFLNEMDERTTVCVPLTLHTVYIKHGWPLGFLRMELVLLHSLMNAQPLHFHTNSLTSDAY